MIDALSLFPFLLPVVDDGFGDWGDPNPCPVEEMGFLSESLLEGCSIESRLLLMVGFEDCEDEDDDEF